MQLAWQGSTRTARIVGDQFNGLHLDGAALEEVSTHLGSSANVFAGGGKRSRPRWQRVVGAPPPREVKPILAKRRARAPWSWDNCTVKATLLLADYAQVADGKLNVLGGGWNIIGPHPMPFALAAIIEVPWHRTNERHYIRIELLDADGRPVLTEQPDGRQAPLVIQADFELGRPPGLKPGVSLNFPVAINVPALPLAPNGTYEWRLSVNDETDDDWRVVFTTRPEAPPGG